jgi:hypothetical protein
VNKPSRRSKALRIKKLPDRVALESLLEPHGLRLVTLTDEPNLYIAIAEKL